ncbi:hypothetical protein DAEQUDRAFT_443313 [Daedalea quercina L-15889]|uniref:Uncharacterized protein n=1 Tax=Daedalea quercina L-15889 TaxID=1314783 RepID=A0A165N9S8_9APHY|nr:hypothetical protein DAEQUDRAFT_443313 [Daedalea quercina L-15889]
MHRWPAAVGPAKVGSPRPTRVSVRGHFQKSDSHSTLDRVCGVSKSLSDLTVRGGCLPPGMPVHAHERTNKRAVTSRRRVSMGACTRYVQSSERRAQTEDKRAFEDGGISEQTLSDGTSDGRQDSARAHAAQDPCEAERGRCRQSCVHRPPQLAYSTRSA